MSMKAPEAPAAEARITVLLFILLTALPGTALPQTIRNLQSIPLVFTCLAQDPAQAQAFWAKRQADDGDQDPDHKDRMDRMLNSSDWAACVRKKQWVSKAYCTDLLEATLAGRRDVARVMDKHEDERKKLAPLYDHFESSFPRGGEPQPGARPCPD